MQCKMLDASIDRLADFVSGRRTNFWVADGLFSKVIMVRMVRSHSADQSRSAYFKHGDSSQRFLQFIQGGFLLSSLLLPLR